MIAMDRKKALEILELPEDATIEDVEKRIQVLFRKFRNIEKDERGFTFRDIDDAYRMLKGIAFSDPEEEARKRYRREHPNPLFKLLRIDEEKARNFIYYYKWYALAIIAVIAIAVCFILSVVNRDDPDLKVLIAGRIYVENTELLAQKAEEEIETVKEAHVQNIYLTGEINTEADIAYQTKFTVELAAGNNDIFIIDEEKYFMLARQGAFIPVREFIGDPDAFGIDEKLNEDLIVAMDPEDGITYEPELYGIDVTDNKYLQDAGAVAERMIMAFGATGENRENAAAFAEMMLKVRP